MAEGRGIPSTLLGHRVGLRHMEIDYRVCTVNLKSVEL